MPCECETVLKVKNTTICCGFFGVETAAYGGLFSKSGFAAVFSGENEVGIDKNISVGYEGKCIT